MVEDIIKDIKKELRANMNGVASAHARQTEDYRVNWGIELPRISMIADEIKQNMLKEEGNEPINEEMLRALSQALWNESTRECKILACMLMPTGAFVEELCDIWAEGIRTEEIATMFCLYLAKRLPYASTKAFEWIACSQPMLQNCGYLTLCHLMRQYELGEDAANEFLDQAGASLDNKYAMRALQIYASLSTECARKVKKVADYL